MDSHASSNWILKLELGTERYKSSSLNDAAGPFMSEGKSQCRGSHRLIGAQGSIIHVIASKPASREISASLESWKPGLSLMGVNEV